MVNQFTKKVLISENMVKYKFNENYDEKQHKFKENVIGFEISSIKTLLTAGKPNGNQQPRLFYKSKVQRLSKVRNE